MPLKNNNCPLCGHEGFKVILSQTRSGRIVRCQNCGFYYTNSLNKERVIVSKDNSAAYDDVSREYYLTKLKEKIVNANLHLNDIEEYTKIKGRLLDIGAYLGIFIQEAQKRGWQAQGIEPVREAAKFAQEKFSLPVENVSLEEFNSLDGSFDLITMYQVIEHLADPVASIEKVNKLLKPGGLLVIETPNIDNNWFKIFKSKWRNFIPEHFQFFDKRTLKFLLGQHNFDVLEVKTVKRVISLEMIGQQLKYNVSKIIGKIFVLLTSILGLKNLNIKLNLGDNIIAFARKK